jgi:hypothetical protein
MTRLLVLVVAGAAIASAGCGGDDGSNGDSGQIDATTRGTSSTSTTGEPGSKRSGGSRPTELSGPKSGTARSGRQEQDVYKRARRHCRAHTILEMARTYEIRSRNPFKVAQAYAVSAYRRSQRPAGFEGCLDGFGVLKP